MPSGPYSEDPSDLEMDNLTKPNPILRWNGLLINQLLNMGSAPS